jgi:DNA-binding PadR family transcriptional regulator
VSDLTPLAVAALALLAERPMHPYEMYQTLITRSEDRLVKVRPGSLYHTVDRLTRQGFVEAVGTDRGGNRPERTTYNITESGQLALSERVAEMLATPVNE